MTLTKKDVTRVAELARLAITDDQTEVYTAQLGRILAHVEKLSELDTAGVPVSTGLLPAQTALREDVAHASVERDAVMNNAPAVERGCFKVPQVIE